MQLYHRWKCPWCAAARQGARERRASRSSWSRCRTRATSATRWRRSAASGGCRCSSMATAWSSTPGASSGTSTRPTAATAFARSAAELADDDDGERRGVRRLRHRRRRRLVSAPGEGVRARPAGDAPYRERRGGGATSSRPGGRRSAPSTSRCGPGASGPATRWPTTGTAPRRRSTTCVSGGPAGGPDRRRGRGGRATATGSACRRTRPAGSRTAPTARPSGSPSARRPARGSPTASGSTRPPGRRSRGAEPGRTAAGGRRGRRARYPHVVGTTAFEVSPAYQPTGDQPRAIARAVGGPAARRPLPDAARRHGLRQDVHDGPRHRRGRRGRRW